MSALQFYDAGCESGDGTGTVVLAARRGLRKLLRPSFVRLVEILNSLVARIERAEGQIAAGLGLLDHAQIRLDGTERQGEILEKRTQGLAAHLAGLNEEHNAVQALVKNLCPRVDDLESEIQAGKVRLGRSDVLIDVSLGKIDSIGARIDAAETRLAPTERLTEILDTRTHGLAAHLAGLNEEHLALQADLRNLSPKVAAAESRLASFDWHVGVLHPRTEGLAAHLEGLSNDHRALYTEMQARIVQLTELTETISNLGRRQCELDDKLQAMRALHWDHIALTRRLAVIEDLLFVRASTADEPDNRPSLPFPGLEGDEARSRVG